ncbi:hypothetical protein [sulfur-oxidizing endosymbiont of Gigantopelta aegis]|uniref:hypothetical protein n=1 Tax=sulfur-oxidizing endosymbiont of Gigantopelta aegis TaxID=2794934 RepID=UPI0018DD0FED|nr:hypothetical protein [sulfur-oxidizing endosymbiont of Gigantopelta aegis]
MMQHRLSTIDPISMNEVNNLEGKPYLVVGTHYNDLTIYFENKTNRQMYEDIPVECPANDFSMDIGNNIDEGIDEG